MIEQGKEYLSASEYLKRWIREANYEVLPTDKAAELIDIIPEKNTVSVTCRPHGIEDTVRFVELVGPERMRRIWPHIAARRFQNEQHFDEVIFRLLTAGMEKTFIVGGDGAPQCESFVKAEDVLGGLWDRGIRLKKVRIGGYPEGNSVIDMDPTDLLLRKQEVAEKMGLEMEIVTQICLDPETLIDWIKEIRERGVYLPVEVGVLGKIKWNTFIKTLGTLGVNDVKSFLISKPKLAKVMATGVVTGFSPVDFLKELAVLNEPDLKIGGVSIFTLGSISNSVKCLSEMLEDH